MTVLSAGSVDAYREVGARIVFQSPTGTNHITGNVFITRPGIDDPAALDRSGRDRELPGGCAPAF